MGKRLLFISFLLGLLLFSCEESRFRPDYTFSSAPTIESATKVGLSGPEMNVSMKDIEAFLRYEYLSYGKKVVSVQPFADNGDTLIYVINYDEGWDILSGDKRAPILLASGDSGSFSLKTKNVEMLSWIESLAADVQGLKQMEDFSSCSEEQIECMEFSRRFWALIECENDAICPPTRIGPPIDSLPEYPGSGHWEFMGSSTSSVYYDAAKLTQTRWCQDENTDYYPSHGTYFNAYCPLRSNSSTLRAQAGCVAVAGAQMLYFLHNDLGVPQYAQDTAFCVGNINGSYFYGAGQSDSTWNYMLTNSINYRNCYSAAILIAVVGRMVDMDYGDESSGAETEDLVDDVFGVLGINCSFDTYNSSSVSQSLINGMPVIISAKGTRTYVLGIPFYSDGHCFIIDGYRRYRKQYTYTYEWVWDEWHGGHAIPNIHPRVEVSYGSPYITDYRMNWGWSDTDDDAYFAPTGDWAVNDCNYIYKRKMIHGFSVSQ